MVLLGLLVDLLGLLVVVALRVGLGLLDGLDVI